MSKEFKTIGIMGRLSNPGVKETLKHLITYLKNLNQNLLIEEETAHSLDHPDIPIVTPENLSECNLLIVVGGDGSLLHAAHFAVDHNVPVLGINRGSLGFLTDISPNELEKIGEILQGQYNLEQRFLLGSVIELENKIIGKDDALNEVAIIPDTIPHMIEFEIYVDDQFVCSQNSDGIIIATPTGSTAYALSGGGPILHPQLDAVVLVPMFPHTLSSRPIVVEGNRSITILVSKKKTISSRMSCDGRAYIKAPAGSKIIIKKKAKQLQLVHPLDYNYFQSLRSKLHWGKKLK